MAKLAERKALAWKRESARSIPFFPPFLLVNRILFQLTGSRDRKTYVPVTTAGQDGRKVARKEYEYQRKSKSHV